MDKSPNNLQISVPLSIREKLQLMAVDNESVSLVAKRILLEALGENSEASTAIAPDALKEIRDRLDVIDKLIGDLSSREWVQDNRDYIVKIMDEKGLLLIREHEEVLKLLGDRLNQLETGQPELHETMTNLVERLEKLEGWISSLRDDRALAKGSLGKFSDRLDALEKGKVETAPREIPKGMTHKQMAEICDVSVYAVTKMAHDRSKWPEGYLWSNESKKWFPMEV